MDKAYYTISEISEITGLGRTKLYEEVNSGRLVAKKCGSRTLVPKESFCHWMETLPNYPKPNLLPSRVDR